MNGKRLWLVCIPIVLYFGLLFLLGACQGDGDRHASILLLPTADASDQTTAFIVKGLAVNRYFDRRAGVYCWVFRDAFYQVTSMSCLPEAQVTPAPAVIWQQP